MEIWCKVTVDRDADALYIQLASEIGPGEVVANESLPLKSRHSEMVLDFDASHRLLGIEVLGIEGLLPERDKA